MDKSLSLTFLAQPVVLSVFLVVDREATTET